MSRRRSSAAAAALLVVALGTGCGGSTGPPGREPAVPAAAAALTATPAGTVVDVPRLAGGLVADQRTGLVVVGTHDPGRLLLLDGRTGAVVSRLPLQGNPGQLALAAAGGPLLVPTQDADGLLQIALPSGELVSRTAAGSAPATAAAAAGRLLAAGARSGVVAVIDSERLVGTLSGFGLPAAMSPVGNQVAVLDSRTGALDVYDPTTLRKTASAPAGERPTHLVTDRRDRLVVVDTGGNQLVIFQTLPRLTLSQRLPLPGTPYAVAYDPARDIAWVTLTATNEVAGVDLGDPAPRVVARLPTVRQPDAVAVDPGTGRVFVASPALGQLQLVDP